MLAANLPVICQYGMPGQNPSNSGTNNSQGTVGHPISGNNPNSNVPANTNTSSGISGPSNSNSNNNGAIAGNNPVGLVGGGGAGGAGGGTSAVAAKNQLEQLNTMREALFAQDGWGCQHVNQETNWEVPSSPEPTNKDSSGGPPIWKPNINNGTDLWESNLRNGGQPPTQAVQKTPWGHTPSSNLGGTWGEDDDGADSSSVWTGGSSSNPASGVGVGASGVNSSTGGPNAGPQWGQNTVGGVGGVVNSNPAGGTGTVNIAAGGGPVSAGGVNVVGAGSIGGNTTSGNGWGDPRDIRSGPMGGPMDLRNVDPRDPMRATSAGDPRDLRMMDPRDPIRGDPRGISGRLNGNAELWGQHHPSMAHSQLQALNKLVGPGGVVGASGNVAQPNVVPNTTVGGIGPGGVNAMNAAGTPAGSNVNTQWGSPQTVVGPKDIVSLAGGGGNNKQVTGWEEPSPPPQRRNIPNYDDGTSLWGGQQSRVPGGGGSHWKDIPDPMNRNHLIRNTIGNQGGPNNSVISGLGAAGGSGIVASGQNVAPGNVGSSNPPNPMASVAAQGRMPGGGAVVGPGIGGHKPDNSMWVHANSANVTSRNAGSWGEDGSHGVGVGAGVGSNWIDDKSTASSMGQINSGGGGGVGANVGSVSAWSDTQSSWNKNKLSGSAVGGGGGGGAWVGGGSGAGVVPNDNTDINSDWNAPHPSMLVSKQQQMKNVNIVGGLNNDIIKQSKQFRMLVEGGFKKEDVERALIAANMNFEEAAEMLRTANTPIMMDSWRRQEDNLSSYTDHPNSSGVGGGGGGGGGNVFPGRYPTTGAQPTMAFPPNNILNNMAGGVGGVGGNVNTPNIAALNAMQPLQVQKYLNQGGPHNLVGGGPQSVAAANAAAAFGQGATNVSAAAVNAATNTNNQPSAQQLRMLVQQIQMAVQNGYLSNQILNQPLAPATLLLLNQLLSNIKHLQGAQQSIARGNNANNLQINVAIAKYKQQIQNLQNQINTQQTMYVKQQQHQILQQQQQNAPQHAVPNVPHVGGGVGVGNSGEYMRAHDAINALQGNFSEMNMKSTGYQGAPNQQSRLNQWKLPVLEKDLTTDSTDFSRAPGATKQTNSMGSLGLQSDGTWSAARNIGDGWPDSSNDNENKDWSVAQNSAAATYTDLVQEFEPGKPWKGSQIKSIEDDPSITPGSVARSPLSINPTPKEADIFATASKNSPTDLPPLGLSSSTWSFNPSTSNQNFSSWSDNNQQCNTSDLWAASMNKTSRGPPPGLVGSNKVGGVMTNVSGSSVVSSNASNGWLGGGGGRVGVQSASAVGGWSSGGGNSSWNSSWLLLKNLTTQIDSSTLRTLCMQHGPLIAFHLYLNQGIALCKYATREEANKAQMTLNNCVLGNTTICAESPSDNDVQAILQHMPPNVLNAAATPVGGGNGGGGGGNGGGNNHNNSGNNSSNNGNGSVMNTGNNSVLSGGGGGVGGGNNSSSNNGTNGGNNGGGGNNAQSVQSQIQNGSNVGGGGNSGNSNGGNGANNSNPNNSNNGSGANTWRQNASQQQQQLNQTRPAAGRESDYDYISKFVCSIVDD